MNLFDDLKSTYNTAQQSLHTPKIAEDENTIKPEGLFPLWICTVDYTNTKVIHQQTKELT